MSSFRCHLMLLILATGYCIPLAFPDRACCAENPTFNRDIRPILAANCLSCHGSDASHRQAELRLDVPGSALAERDGTFAIKPGEPDHSEVWKRINSSDPDLVMPPVDSKRTLTAAERATIRTWIEQGAVFQQHWAFEAPQLAPVPDAQHADWVRTPIDWFVLQRLEQQGLTPQPAASRETLIRRVAFTLTGLPPSLDEIDRFLNDRRDGAYERMVDRYLESERYGEEQARHWLDVARYADTHGLHLDNERQMWLYRDWVVRAFNQNLPFDEFTTWQLAGDLLPNPTIDQRIATGFNRCNVTTSEGGSIQPEWLYRYAVERTSTTVETWMGLTAGCAVCHDHKYDPLSTKEFYSLYAFFYSAADPAMDGNIAHTRPFLKVPSPKQQQQLDQLNEQISKLDKRLELAVASIDYHDPADTITGEPAAAKPAAGDDTADSAPAGSDQTPPVRQTPPARKINDVLIDDDFPLGTRLRNTSRNDVPWVLDPDFQAKSGRRVIEMSYGAQFDITAELALIPVLVPDQGVIEFWLRTDPHYPPQTFALQFDDGKVNRRAVWGAEALLSGGFQHVKRGPIPEPGEWTKLSVPLHELGLEPGTHIKKLVLIQYGGRVWVDEVRIHGQTPAANDPLSSFTAWWKASKGGNPADISGELSTILKAGPQESVAEEKRRELLRFYLSRIQRTAESGVADERRELRAAELERVILQASIPGTLTFEDLAEPREAFVMKRGQYDQPGEKVEPGVPAIFPPLSVDPADDGSQRRANRLDLARWLLSPEHPLTARVAVNRFWQQIFGTGLVKTSADFGTRGDIPSHPELLDWLAIHFRESGWDTRALLKMMVTSAAFRQRSVIPPHVYRVDPDNRLLARGPRFRLDAEQLRDNALFVSGLINLEMGGRGVTPYQPPNIWEPVGYENSNTRFYRQQHGPDLYRRSLYCFLKRTAPPPFMSNFDGPNREQSCTRRERSNTPLQALQLMNDTQHFEAARALAERALSLNSADDDQRITFLYRTVLARTPRPEELQIVRGAVQRQRQLFAADQAAAERTIAVGESQPHRVATAMETAAWTMIANLMLNLDETVTRN